MSDPLIEDYTGVDDTSKGAIFGAAWRGQVFTASSSYSATSFKVLVSTNGAPGTLTGGLYAVSAAKPTGSALASATFPGNTLTGTASFAEFVLSAGVALTSGTQYALVFAAPSGSSGAALTLRVKNVGTYAGGSYVFSSNSGTSWSTDAGDAVFQVFGLAGSGGVGSVGRLAKASVGSIGRVASASIASVGRLTY